MGKLLSVLMWWEGVIVKTFAQTPIFATVVTFACVVAFWFVVRKERIVKKIVLTPLGVLGWAVVLPILGALWSAIVGVWIFGVASLPFTLAQIVILYEVMVHYPLVFIAIVSIGVLGFVVWNRKHPTHLAYRILRGIVVFLAVYGLAHIIYSQWVL